MKKWKRTIRRLLHRPTPWVAPVRANVVRSGDLDLSIVVICYEMDEQVGNTVRTLVPPYQVGVNPLRYEVLVVDNGSKEPLDAAVWNLSPNVVYRHIPKGQASVHPGVAINEAVAKSRGKYVCVMIDGARMVTPGAVSRGLELVKMLPRGIVDVRSWHLGPKLQMESVQEGYSRDVERGLLAQVNWPQRGYGLFEVATAAASCPGGFYGRAKESNCLFMSREYFDELGGYDERYKTPGGGLANIDFFWRAVSGAERIFTVLGEGTFHQLHGGASTGQTKADVKEAYRRWRDEYEMLSRPHDGKPPKYESILAGHLPVEAKRWMARGLS